MRVGVEEGGAVLEGVEDVGRLVEERKSAPKGRVGGGEDAQGPKGSMVGTLPCTSS